MGLSSKSLLVYIPCHSDLESAIDQARSIREQNERLLQSGSHLRFKVEIVISINNFSPTSSQINLANTYCDLVLCQPEAFLADANIANGYRIANQLESNYLWILSANDTLIEGSISIIMESLTDDMDLLVTKIPDSKQLNKIYNVIHPAIKGYSFGLISGVIYNCDKMRIFFDVAHFFIWTGWSQLSVIQNAINQNGSLSIRTVDTFKIYEQRQTNIDKLAYKYGHSFYGYILLGYVFIDDKKMKRKFVREYILNNTFKITLYRRRVTASNLAINPTQYLIWNQDLAEGIIKKLSTLLYCYYLLVSRIPFHLVKKSMGRYIS